MEPQHPDSENEVNLFDHERRCFDLALAFLKETKGGDYKFVLLVTMCPLTTSKGWGTHTYFFAHLKGTNSSPELFFADVVLAPVNSVHCCKVDPSSFSLGKAPLQFEVISHCPHVKCFECVDHCNYEFESDIEAKLILRMFLSFTVRMLSACNVMRFSTISTMMIVKKM
uniref:DUF3615 domain-containing protein n=1 Tax=Chenopodium quinoa TaxID=63459 RepID=A0A803LVR3_CHEQI